MSLETLNVSGTTVETGNLVFSENIENTTKNKGYYLRSYNQKVNITSNLWCGIFFEFYKNLEALNEFSKRKISDNSPFASRN